MSSRGLYVAIVGLPLLALATPLHPAAAQAAATGRIEGMVVESRSQRPLAGATVLVAGTTRGAMTNDEGRFVLVDVPAGRHQLSARRIGFESASLTVTVTSGQTTTANFNLTETAIRLDEVVVTGTAGETRRRELGTAVSSINAEEIEAAPVQNIQDIVGARATGVTVLANSGQPGAGGTIKLRGINSLSQGNAPLIYVDGVRIYSEEAPAAWAARQNTLPVNDINAEDIERVEIVKGAAATTLYGTQASGGVIQIFTKRGQLGQPAWNAEVTGGFNNMGHVGPDDDPTGLFLNKCRGPELVDTEGVPFVDPTCPASGSWLQNGPIQRYSASVRGGSEAMSYYLSANYDDEQGVIATGFSKDGGFRGNFSFRPAERLELSMSSAYTKRVTRWVPDGNNASGFALNVFRGPFNNFKGGQEGECDAITETCVTNAYILEQQNFNRNDHFITGFTVNYAPLEQWTNRLTIGYDFNKADNQTHYPFGYLRSPRGFIWGQDWTHTKLSLDYAGSLRNAFGAALTSSFSWGGQLFEDRDYYVEGDAYDFAGPSDPTRSSAARTEIFLEQRIRVINAGFFLQEMLGWRDRLFVTGGLRIDGNSAFGQDFGLKPYPKVSASYVISEHDFWPTDRVETLKLRAAYGASGKAPGAFDAVRTWHPIAADEGEPGFSPAQIGNPQLGPETTYELEGGFDLSALGGRIGLDVTAFRATTTDALIAVEYPPSLGFIQSQLENVGELRNSGIEAQLNATLVQTPWLNWRGRLGYTGLKSKVIDLGGREIYTGVSTWAKEGFPIGAYFGTKITNPDEIAEPILVRDAHLGNVYPDRIWSIGTTVTLNENLTLDVLGEYQGGAMLANWVGYQNARRGIWIPCYGVQAKLRTARGPDEEWGTADDVPTALGDVTALERAKCAIDRERMDDTYWIQPADFFKIRSASLTYNIPTRFVPGSRSASLTLAGRNLFTSTEYEGTDPEVRDARDQGGNIGRRDYYNLPPVRTFTASLRVSF